MLETRARRVAGMRVASSFDASCFQISKVVKGRRLRMRALSPKEKGCEKMDEGRKIRSVKSRCSRPADRAV